MHSIGLDNIKPPPSLKEMAFQSIKEGILSQRLKSGEFYTEQNLAKELGISKTPVREALLDLAIKGFIVYLPRKGIKINTLAEKEIVDLYGFRNALEKDVIRRITPRLTKESIKIIEAMHKEVKEATRNCDMMWFMRIDRQFHMFLASLTDNQYIISALEHIRDLSDWLGSKALLSKEDMVESKGQHGKIIQMLKKGNVEGAEAAIEEHIQKTQSTVLDHLKEIQR